MKRVVFAAVIAIGCGHEAAKSPPPVGSGTADAVAKSVAAPAPDAAAPSAPPDAAAPSASARPDDAVTNVCDGTLIGDRCTGNGTSVRTHTDGSTTLCTWKRGVATCRDEPPPP